MTITFFDWLFILAALLFNLLIAGIFIFQKFNRENEVRNLGRLWLSLAIPLLVVFFNYLSDRKPLWVIACFGLVFLYMLVELLLDHVFRVDFRSKWITHAPYIVLEYAALFSLIAVAIEINPTFGWVVSASFWILMGSLIYLYAGRRRSEKA